MTRPGRHGSHCLGDELAATADGEPRALLAAAWLYRRNAELLPASPDRDQVERQADKLTIQLAVPPTLLPGHPGVAAARNDPRHCFGAHRRTPIREASTLPSILACWRPRWQATGGTQQRAAWMNLATAYEMRFDLAISKMRAKRRKRRKLAEALGRRFEERHGEPARILLNQIDVLTRKIDQLSARVSELIAQTPAAAAKRAPDHFNGGHADETAYRWRQSIVRAESLITALPGISLY